MKLIIAFVRPFKLEEIREALSEIGTAGLTVTDVRFWRQKGQSKYIDECGGFCTKNKIRVAVPDDKLDLALDSIAKAARTGKIGTARFLLRS